MKYEYQDKDGHEYDLAMAWPDHGLVVTSGP